MRKTWRAALRPRPDVPPGLADLGIAVFVALIVSAAFSAPLPPGSTARPADVPGHLLAVLLCAPLVARRHFPRAGALAVVAVAEVLLAIGYSQVNTALVMVVAAYSLGRYLAVGPAVPFLAVLLAELGLEYWQSRSTVSPAELLNAGLILLGAFWLGANLRAWRTELARQAIADERLRIARELHDVVAHGMSVVAVQAGMARMVLDARPDQAAEALDVIASTSRTSLAELRRMLGVLRPDDATGGELRPAPGPADLPELAERTTRAGVTVTLHGTAGELPVGLGLAVYRIVQEALTNTFKHAGPGASADVRLDRDAGGLTIQVTDDGRGDLAPAGTGGVGLAGMRERVVLFGGDLRAGPRDGGGWRVTARLPLSGNPDGAA